MKTTLSNNGNNGLDMSRSQMSAISMLTRKFSTVAREMLPIPIDAMHNDLLKSLPACELSHLLPDLQLVHLSADAQLFEHGSKLSHIYFPTTAIIAMFYLLDDGHMKELCVTGNEGSVGGAILTNDRLLGTATVQIAGLAYRIKAARFRESVLRCRKLMHSIMRYEHAQFAKMALSAVYAQRSTVEQQLSCWLLDRIDRLPTNELNATQETIANFLGVRRESVTESAGKLRQASLIRYRHGTIFILDRNGLEERAGDCYKVPKQEFDLALAANSATADSAADAA